MNFNYIPDFFFTQHLYCTSTLFPGSIFFLCPSTLLPRAHAPIESVTYARSPSPEPPISGTRYTPLYRELVTIDSYIYKKIPFPGFLGESSRDHAPKYPLSRKMGTRMRPVLCLQVGRGRGLECIFVEKKNFLESVLLKS